MSHVRTVVAGGVDVAVEIGKGGVVSVDVCYSGDTWRWRCR